MGLRVWDYRHPEMTHSDLGIIHNAYDWYSTWGWMFRIQLEVCNNKGFVATNCDIGSAEEREELEQGGEKGWSRLLAPDGMNLAVLSKPRREYAKV
jgi:hypothetical protein